MHMHLADMAWSRKWVAQKDIKVMVWKLIVLNWCYQYGRLMGGHAYRE